MHYNNIYISQLVFIPDTSSSASVAVGNMSRSLDLAWNGIF